MPQFNQGTYEIYWHKSQDNTPNSPLSPTTSLVQSPTTPASSLRRGAAIGIGLVMAKRASNTFINEMTASTGNERFQIDINNAIKGVGYVSAIAVGGVTAAIGIGVDTALSAVSYYRGIRRQNTMQRIDQQLKGKRVNIASGSAYYD